MMELDGGIWVVPSIRELTTSPVVLLNRHIYCLIAYPGIASDIPPRLGKKKKKKKKKKTAFSKIKQVYNAMSDNDA